VYQVYQRHRFHCISAARLKGRVVGGSVEAGEVVWHTRTVWTRTTTVGVHASWVADVVTTDLLYTLDHFTM